MMAVHFAHDAAAGSRQRQVADVYTSAILLVSVARHARRGKGRIDVAFVHFCTDKLKVYPSFPWPKLCNKLGAFGMAALLG